MKKYIFFCLAMLLVPSVSQATYIDWSCTSRDVIPEMDAFIDEKQQEEKSIRVHNEKIMNEASQKSSELATLIKYNHIH